MNMSVFLGDVVTIMKEDNNNPTMVTGQVSGVVLNDTKQLERIYIHGFDSPFYMDRGWLFVETEDEDAEI